MVYSRFGSNFVKTMLRLAAERDRLRVVDDQVGCPTYAPDLAAAILAIARRTTNSGWKADFAGVTHIAGPDTMTWCGFAREIIDAATPRGGRSVPVDPMLTLEYPTPAVRPANSCLSTARLQAVFDIRLPRMRSSLEVCLDRLLRR
jgi:dTDP-4-dehydrorhamnose reductase